MHLQLALLRFSTVSCLETDNRYTTIEDQRDISCEYLADFELRTDDPHHWYPEPVLHADYRVYKLQGQQLNGSYHGRAVRIVDGKKIV